MRNYHRRTHIIDIWLFYTEETFRRASHMIKSGVWRGWSYILDPLHKLPKIMTQLKFLYITIYLFDIVQIKSKTITVHIKKTGICWKANAYPLSSLNFKLNETKKNFHWDNQKAETQKNVNHEQSTQIHKSLLCEKHYIMTCVNVCSKWTINYNQK
jgi:hypothetical protein